MDMDSAATAKDSEQADDQRAKLSGASSDEDDDDQEEKELSKRQLKKKNRLSVAQLKQLVDRPDVVEVSSSLNVLSLTVC